MPNIILVRTESKVARGACVSGLAHRMLFVFEEYFKSDSEVQVKFIRQLAGDSPFAQELYKEKRPIDCMRAILGFLQRGVKGTGLQKRINQPKVDCARFCLRALHSLIDAPDNFAIRQTNFWEVYAALGVGACGQWERKYVPAHTDVVLDSMVNKFRETKSWQLRAKIINGFKGIAREFSRRDTSFWEACDYFMKYWQVAVATSKGKLPKPISEGVTDLVDTWRILATRYGKDRTVKRKTIGVALTLLKWISKAELTFNLGVERLSECLLALHLAQAHPWATERVVRDRKTQLKLEGIANELIKISKKFKGREARHFRDISRNLLPYLRGYTATRDRRTPIGTLACTVQLNIGGKLKEFSAHLNDVCAETFRAFSVDVDGILLDKDYVVLKNYRGKMIGGIPCRKVRVKQTGLRGLVPIEQIIFKVRDLKAPKKTIELAIPCRILRASRSSESCSHFVIWSPESEFPRLPSGWKPYVRGMPKKEK